MAAGEARKLFKSNSQPSIIFDRHGRPQNDPIWKGVPYIVARAGGKPYNKIVNGPGCRPYIAGKTINNWTWRKYKPIPAEIIFTPEERAFAEPYRGMVMIEPNVKNIGHDNKAWIVSRWLELSKTRSNFVQCVSTPEQSLPAHVLKVITPNFRLAAAVLAVAKAYIGTEGGLHHAAAAVGTPAVVLFGGFISPAVTGYATHRNIFTGTGTGCGNRTNCEHCRKAMAAITVDRVISELESILGHG